MGRSKARSNYNLAMIFLSCAVWVYALSWIFAKPLWLRLIIGLRRHYDISAESMLALLNSTVVALAIVTCGAVLIHILVICIPDLRARCRPHLICHVSAFSLVWIAKGSTEKISSEVVDGLVRYYLQ